MLISFRATNFRSLRDEGELSLVVPSWVDTRDTTFAVDSSSDLRLGTVAAIYGSNASGKTNVIRALWMMSVIVANSHQHYKSNSSIPYQPFFVGEFKRLPTQFEADILIGGRRYQYGFAHSNTAILKEWLYSFPKSRPRLLFERDVERSGQFRFGRTLGGRPGVIAELTRPNSLFLSAAAANNHPELTPIAEWFDERIQRTYQEDTDPRIVYTAIEDEGHRARLLNLLKLADLGICDIAIDEEQIPEQVRERIAAAMSVISPKTTLDEDEWRFFEQTPQLAHEVDGEQPVFLDLAQESNGTRTWLSLAGPIVEALGNGGVLLVDELDASLHPRLSSEVVRMFHNPEVNPLGAQLIFNTHDPSLMGALLGDAPLRRDEVWFTEKGRDGASRLYPLTDFRPRKAENLERGYLQGRYGGVPFVDQDYATAALSVGGATQVGPTTQEGARQFAETGR